MDVLNCSFCSGIQNGRCGCQIEILEMSFPFKTKLWGNNQRKMLKSLDSDVQDGHHGNHFDFFQMTYPPEPCVGVNRILVETLRQHGDSELLKSLYSDIQDAAEVAFLGFFKHSLLPKI